MVDSTTILSVELDVVQENKDLSIWCSIALLEILSAMEIVALLD